MITVLFFGKLSDVAEPMRFACPVGVSTMADLRRWLASQNENLRKALSQPGNRTARNQQLVSDDSPVMDGDEIAFMSPLSGG